MDKQKLVHVVTIKLTPHLTFLVKIDEEGEKFRKNIDFERGENKKN